ncbi:MAG TPA: hypothetical protein VND66_11375 [Acidobacteriaceae bacterium]|nr:hypothetical protein [Acidobacteriaceae bacterium]
MSPLQEIIEEAVSALTRLDGRALDRIRSEIQELKAIPPTAEDIAAITTSHRLLGALLQETERNLRLFQVNSVSGRQTSEAGCYALPPR